MLRPSEKDGLGIKPAKGVEVFITLTPRGHPGSDLGLGVKRHNRRNWLTLLKKFFSPNNRIFQLASFLLSPYFCFFHASSPMGLYDLAHIAKDR